MATKKLHSIRFIFSSQVIERDQRLSRFKQNVVSLGIQHKHGHSVLSFA